MRPAVARIISVVLLGLFFTADGSRGDQARNGQRRPQSVSPACLEARVAAAYTLHALGIPFREQDFHSLTSGAGREISLDDIATVLRAKGLEARVTRLSPPEVAKNASNEGRHY